MAKNIIDLRSDTVTQPTPEMRQVMARAEVGDDVFGDDPSVNRLERRVAELFGMDAALFVPSGTMANQVAIRCHTQPGDEIICHRESHVHLYEGGAASALAGCSMALIDGDRGMFTSEDVRQTVKPDDPHFPKSTLVVVENTQNCGGGTVWSVDAIADIRTTASQLDLKMHLDGARIMNACVASKVSPNDYATHFDSITICFSKGLGAPVGSAVAGGAGFIARARRFRKMYGGGMRQAGVLAAAAEYALDHHVERLVEDHANARLLADGLATCAAITVGLPETNIVYFDIDPAWGSAAKLEDRARQHGVSILAVGHQRLRAVTHLHVTPADVDQATNAIRKILGRL